MLKIISGGQTGVDRGALDAARELGFDSGGWCPARRLAEDGTIPKSYRMQEMPTEEYAARTEANVRDSDGTLIICKGEPTGGTRATVRFCRELEKPFLLIDCDEIEIEEAVERAAEFVQRLSIRAAETARNLASVRQHGEAKKGPSHALGTTLNVAGPRASQWPDGYDFTKRILAAVLRTWQCEQP